MKQPYCPCGARLDTYEELKTVQGDSLEAQMARYIADAYLSPNGFYCADEDDVLPPEYVVWK